MTGRFRYFVVDTGFGFWQKELPVGYCQIDAQARRIYATGILNKSKWKSYLYNEVRRLRATMKS